MSLAIFFSFYGKVSGAGLTHASQICPCLELSFPDSPFLISFHYNLAYDPLNSGILGNFITAFLEEIEDNSKNLSFFLLPK